MVFWRRWRFFLAAFFPSLFINSAFSDVNYTNFLFFRLFRERAGPVHGKRRDVHLPDSGWTVTELGMVPLTSGIEAQRVMALNLQCSFSTGNLFDPIPRAKAVWLFPAVPKSGGVTVRAWWVSNYQSHIDKFTPVHLIFLLQLWQSCENRTGEIMKDFAVLSSFRTSIRAFG